MADLVVQLNVTRLNVCVHLPDGSIGNPIAAGFVDLRSKLILAARFGANGALLAREAFAELLRKHGRPAALEIGEGCTADVMLALREECAAHGGLLIARPDAAPFQRESSNG